MKQMRLLSSTQPFEVFGGWGWCVDLSCLRVCLCLQPKLASEMVSSLNEFTLTV